MAQIGIALLVLWCAVFVMTLRFLLLIWKPNKRSRRITFGATAERGEAQAGDRWITMDSALRRPDELT